MTNDDVLKILKERGINKSAAALGGNTKEEMPQQKAEPKQGFMEQLKTQFSPQANLNSIKQKGLAGSLADTHTVQGVLGFGDEVNNMARALFTSLTRPVTGQSLNPIENGSGTAYDAGKMLGNMITYLGGGGVAKSGLQNIPKIGKSLASDKTIPAAGRGIIGGTSAAALLNPDDQRNAAEEGFIWSTASELLPASLKQAYGASRSISGNKALEQAIQSIKNGSMSAKNKVDTGYNSLHEQHGNINMLPQSAIPGTPSKSQSVSGDYFHGFQTNPAVSGIADVPGKNAVSQQYIDKIVEESAKKSMKEPSMFDWLPSGTKKLNDEFLAEGTYKNAHDLQSAIGKEIGSLSKTDNYYKQKKDTLIELRNLLVGDMDAHLKSVDEGALKKLTELRSFSHNVHYPYQSNPLFRNIAEGNNNRTTLSGIQTAIEKGGELKKGKNTPDIPKSHQMNKDLEKIYESKNVGSLLGLGSLLDAAKSKFGIDILGSTIENPAMVELARALQKPYGAATKGATSAYVNRESE